MRPNFDAQLIGDLRLRVISHNQAHPEAPAKLGTLRKVYERGFRRSNPGVRAMARVDAYLDELGKGQTSPHSYSPETVLAKADDFEEDKHPRKNDGEFSSKGEASLPLPKTTAAHKQLQQENAGYRALTSDIIPERRNETIGTIGRDVGSYAAGAALVGAMARNKKNGPVVRAARTAGSFTGGIAGGAASWTAAKAAQGVGRVIRKPMPDNKAAMLRRGGQRVGAKVGGAIAAGSVRVASTLVQGAVKAAGNGDIPDFIHNRRPGWTRQNMKGGLFHKKMLFADARDAARAKVARWDRTYKGGRKALVFGLMAGAAGTAIRDSIKDSVMDPAGIGRIADTFEYRTVQKLAASDELGVARRRITAELAKGGHVDGSMESLQGWLEQGNGDLRKYGLPSMRLFSAGAAGVGALVGAAAGYGSSKATQPKPATLGNGQWDEDEHPRDDHGRFADKAKMQASRNHRFAQVGALLGGAAAGIGAWRAMKAKNARVFRAAYQALDLEHTIAHGKAMGVVDGIKGEPQGPRAKAARHNADARRAEIISTHPELEEMRRRVANLEQHGQSDSSFAVDAVRGAHMGRLAVIASGSPTTFRINHRGQWRNLADTVHEKSGPSELRVKAYDAIADMTPEEFKQHATANVLPEIRQTMHEVHDRMEREVGQVPGQLDSHIQDLRRLNTAKIAQDVEVQRRDTAAKVLEAQAAAADDASRPAILDQVQVARDHHMAGHADLQTIKAQLLELQQTPIGVRHPYTGLPIRPPSADEVKTRIAGVKTEMETRAKAIVDSEVSDASLQDALDVNREYADKRTVLTAKHVRTGVPKMARAAAQRLAELKGAEDAALDRMQRANMAHIPVAAEHADLERMTVRGRDGSTRIRANRPEGMARDRFEDLRNREQTIRTSHAETSAELEAATNEFRDRRQERLTQQNAMNEAMRHDEQHRRGPFIPEEVKQQFRDDFQQAKADLHGPVKEFLETKSGKALRDAVASGWKTGKKYAGQAGRGVQRGAKASWNKTFFVPGPNGEPEFSPRKAFFAGSSMGALYGASREDVATMKDRWFGDEDQKKAAYAKNTKYQRESMIDPSTGGGYIAVTIPDPKNKGERLVVWGERFEHGDAPGKPVYAGSRLSDLRTQAEEQRKRNTDKGNTGNSQAGVGAFDLGDDNKMVNGAVDHLRRNGHLDQVKSDDAGPSFQFRKEDHQPDTSTKDKNGQLVDRSASAAGPIYKALRDKFGINAGQPENGKYHGALGGVFSDKGSALKASQAYKIITGHDKKGDKGNDAIFARNPGFGSAEHSEVADALSTEIDRVMGGSSRPINDAQRNNLLRAAAVVAHVKGLDADTMKPIYAKIRGTSPNAGAGAGASTQSGANASASTPPPFTPGPAPEPSATNAAFEDMTAAPARRRPLIDEHVDAAGRQRFDLAGVRAHIQQDLKELHEALPVEVEPEGLLHLVAALARHYHANATTSLDAPSTAKVVARSLKDLAVENEAKLAQILHPDNAAQSDSELVRDQEFQHLVEMNMLMEEGRQQNANKMAPLGAFQRLAKMSMGGFASELHGSGAGSRLFAEGAEAAGKVASRPGSNADGSDDPSPRVRQPRQPKVQAWNHPVRIGAEMGGSVGYEAALAAGSMLPKSVGTLGRLAIENIGGMAASEKTGEAGEALGRKVYSAQTGKKAPGYNPPEPHSAGELAASLGGSAVGGMAGNTAGKVVGAAAGRVAGAAVGGMLGRTAGSVVGAVAGPAGMVVGGTVAGWAGDKIATSIYDHFAGYGQPQAERAMNRFGVPKARTPSALAKPASARQQRDAGL